MYLVLAEKKETKELLFLCALGGGITEAFPLFEKAIQEVGLKAPDKNGSTGSENYPVIKLVPIPQVCNFSNRDDYDILKKELQKLV